MVPTFEENIFGVPLVDLKLHNIAVHKSEIPEVMKI